jgi:hypothetical protein
MSWQPENMFGLEKEPVRQISSDGSAYLFYLLIIVWFVILT